MKKRFTTLMAMVMTVGTICMAGTALAEQANSEGEETAGHTLTGTVNWEAAWEVSESMAITETDAIWSDFSLDFFEKISAVTVSNFDSNDAVYVSIAKGYWTGLPTNYEGVKKAADAGDSDLLVQVQTVTGGLGDHPLTVVTNSDAYVALVSNGASHNLVEGGDTGVYGIEDAGFILDFKVMMDWLTDVPGTYTTNVKMTVAQGIIGG